MPIKIISITTKTRQEVKLGKLNILVGPNNCGKSQTLRDIRDYVAGVDGAKLKIINAAAIETPSKDEICNTLRISPHQNPDHTRFTGVANDLQRQYEIAPHKTWFDSLFDESNNAKPSSATELLRHLGIFWVAHLDAEGRFKLTAPTESFETRTESPSNALQEFFSNYKDSYKELRSAFRDAFAMDIAFDWAAMKRWRLCVGKEFGDIPENRDQLDTLLAKADGLTEQGDGYKSFAGVALAMLTFSDRLLLLDEPEAFLHPAQARTLGRWLSTQALKRNAQVIVASHSADFLWGVISSDVSATIIRLNRSSEGTTFHITKPEITKGLVQSPLLSSQPVMDALFYKGAVICEGDPDRAIYQTVAHKFLAESGGEDVLFIHSNGKDALKNPISLLREAGTPTCAIVDFDVLNSESTLSQVVNSLTGTPASEKILSLRRKVADFVNQEHEENLLSKLLETVRHWLSMSHGDFRGSRKILTSNIDNISK
jgi:ABC-type cobalamin/Fe3+-siderophores transport system ATPase subunit